MSSTDLQQFEDVVPEDALSKQDRKRLKKLRKRATNVIHDGEHSGILIQSEWLELQKLLTASTSANKASNLGPLIGRRKRKESNKVEASHHRDLLAWFMNVIHRPNGLLQQPKKRCRSEDNPLRNPSIPSWVSVHNPASVSNVVVLEVHVPESADIEACRVAVNAAVSQTKGRTALHAPTKLFQGHQPKSLSDGLLYFVTPSEPYKKQAMEGGDHETSMDQIIQALEDMVLPVDSWNVEGYPTSLDDMSMIAGERSETKVPAVSSLQNLESIPLNESVQFLEATGFRIKGQNELDKNVFVKSLKRTDTTGDEGVRVFGLDCEMVKTSVGSELARITLIELTSFRNDKMETKTILDALVKPESPVKDYLTRHSGITAELLDPVTTTLKQVQIALLSILRPPDILVGHSLENDLIAAHFIHPRVIDTALIFRHRNKRTKFSLRHISAALLKRNIQRRSHCSEEDAVAALELAVRRARQGDSFVLPNTDERRSIMEMWNASKELKRAAIGPASWLQTHFTNTANGIHALGCDSLAACSKAIRAWTTGSRKAHLVWSNVALNDGLPENNLESFQTKLIDILEYIPPTTVTTIAIQAGLEATRKRLKTRRAAQDPRSSMGWGDEQEEAWKLLLEVSRNGLVVWISASNELPVEQ